MKRIVLAVILILGALFCAFGQSSSPIDLILLLDTSSDMGSSYETVSNYVTGPFLSEFLRVGDTFHLIVYSGSPRLDAARRVESVGDLETIIGRILIQYPVESGNNPAAAISYAENYAASLPSRPKKIVMVGTGGSDINSQITAARQRLASRNTSLDFVLVTPGQPLANLPSSGRAVATTQRPAATPSVQTPAQTTPQAPSTTSPAQTGQTPPAQTQQQTPSTTSPAQTTQTPPAQTQQQTPSTTPQAQTGQTPSTQTQQQTPSTTSPAQIGQTPSTQTQQQTPSSSDPQTSSAQPSGTSGVSSENVPPLPAGTTPPSQTQAEGTAGTSTVQPQTPPSARETQPADNRQTTASGSRASSILSSSLPLIIGIIVLVLLILGLIIFFVSRRLGSSPNRVMASASTAKPKTQEKEDMPPFVDHSKDLASYAAGQNKQRSTPYTDRPVKTETVAAPVVINPSGPLLLNLFVEDQNTAIGKRNIHSLKSGYSLTVGGGQSDFLIFLVTIPPNIGEIRRNGSQCSFIPRKPKYFPDLGSTELRDCINKTIRIISDKNYELRFRFEMYEDPLEALNKVLHSVRVPG